MLKYIVVVIAFLQLKLISAFDDVNDDLVSVHIEDNVIDGKFVSLSKFNIRLSRQSNLEIIPSRTILSSQYNRLIEESRVNSHLYYTVKLHYKRRTVQDYVMASVPMCLILQAKFQYNLHLFINENGYIISVNIQTNNSTCSMSNIVPIEKQNDLMYKVPLRFHFNDLGPQPEIQHFLEKLKREREAKMSIQENDNRPFILKYWKYLLPVVIIFVLQGAFTDPGASGGGR